MMLSCVIVSTLSIMRRSAGEIVRRVLTGRHWFRCAMAALALRYVSQSVARNGPYWEPDVAYLHWSTDVPAVTVCPTTVRRTVTDPRSEPEYFEVDNTLGTNVMKWTEDFKKKIFLHEPAELWFDGTRDLLQHAKRMDANAAVTSMVVTSGQTANLLYNVRQIVEDSSLATLDFSTRGCVLHGERKLHRHPVYGQSACLLECALREPRAYTTNHTLCNCPPTCATMEINIIWNGTQRSFDNVTRCELAMSTPATERLVMKAKKDYIDLTVIFACILQLFTGFNLLEIPKFITNQKKKYLSVHN